MDFVTDQNETFVSDWRGTAGLDLVADEQGFFILEIPIPDGVQILGIELQEEGELRLEVMLGDESKVLLDQGDSGPGIPSILRLEVGEGDLDQGYLRLRFKDSDPSDGWGPNVNWIRLLW